MSEDVTLRSVSLERRLLGGLIKNPKVFITYEIFSYLTEADFTNGHKTIFNVLKNQISTGASVDTAIITEKIVSFGIDLNGKTEKEIYQYLDNISFKEVNDEVLVESAKEIKKLTIARELCDTCDLVKKQVKENKDKNADELISIADSTYNGKITKYDIDDKPVDPFLGLKEEIEERAKNPVKETGYETPFLEFNRKYGGLRKGGLYCWVSPFKAGKSTLLNYMAMHCARNHPGLKVLVLDTEMSTEENKYRAAAALTEIPSWWLETGNFVSDEVMIEKWKKNAAKLEEYQNLIEHIYVGGKTNEEIEAIIRRWVLGVVGRGGQAMVIFDYIKMLSSDSSNNRQEWEVIAQRVNKLKELAGTLDIVILSACQMNAEGMGDVKKDDALCISQSKRIAWFVTGIWIFRQKTHIELGEDGQEWGTHKMIEIGTRFQGRDAHGFSDYIEIMREEGEGKNKKLTKQLRRNFINYRLQNFNITEHGTLQDIVDSKKNKPVDLGTDDNGEEDTLL